MGILSTKFSVSTAKLFKTKWRLRAPNIKKYYENMYGTAWSLE
jgi:hypothetical protein